MDIWDLKPAYMFKAGIYKITHKLTGKVYVGSAVNIINRWRIHRDDLKYNRHGNVYLQGFYNKDGLDSLIFWVLEFCEKTELLAREQHWMNKLNSVVPNGCNILPIAGSRLGTKHSEETKKKLKEARRKRIITDETRARMSNTMKGRIISPEHRRKLSEAHKGKPKIRKNKIIRKVNLEGLRQIECKIQT